MPIKLYVEKIIIYIVSGYKKKRKEGRKERRKRGRALEDEELRIECLLLKKAENMR